MSDKLFARANLSCIKPIQALYYTLNYPKGCAHCGSKSSDVYPICKPCKEVKKKIPIVKRERKNVAAEKDD